MLIAFTLLTIPLMIFLIYMAVKIRIAQRVDLQRNLEAKYYKAKYCIKFSKEIMCINPRLVASQKCEENVEQIKHLHSIRLALHSLMEILEIKKEYNLLRNTNDLYTQLEFQLQDFWKFERNIKFHKFWKRPGCSCPVLDNEDSYPHQSIINSKCKIHGQYLEDLNGKS